MNRLKSRRSRIWWMRSLAIVISFVPFVVVELICRALEPPVIEAFDRDPLVDLSQLDPLFELDESGQRWVIPESRMNFFRPDSFLAVKPNGCRRIFVVGGSTVQGRPYSTETAFSTWLRLRLESRHPDTTFEVVNCGGVSYASYRVSKIVDQVLNHQPDAIVIYTGHNEFLEDREYADVRNMHPAQRATATTVGKLATVRWLRRRLSQPPPARTTLAGEVDTRLDHVDGLAKYQRDATWRAAVEQHFGWTLTSMVQRIQAAGVPVVLCVPASDLVNTPPFKVTSPPTWGEEERQALESLWRVAQDQTNLKGQRIEAAQQCLVLDPEHAGANFVAGRIGLEEGNREAPEMLRRARDFDVCPLRATTPIMETVAAIASQQQTGLVITDRLLDRRNAQMQTAPDDIPDPEFFVDHVHPTIRGHQIIADAIFDALDDQDWARAGDGGAEQRYQKLVEQQMASLGEEYFARGRQRLRGLQNWAAGRAGKPAVNP